MKHYKRIIAAITVLLFALGTKSALASTSSPTVSVTPNTGLVDGQTVQVSGSGFQANIDLAIIECGPVQPFPLKGGPRTATCSYYFVLVTTDANGNFSATDFTVSTVIQGDYRIHGHNVPDTYDCTVKNDCHLHLYTPHTGSASVNQDISFAQ